MEETLGKRIVANRKRLGITQDRLAEQLGVTAQAVSKWENDQSCPDITMLPKLAEIFGISTDTLLGIAAQEPEPLLETELITPDDTGKPSEDDSAHMAKGNFEFRWDGGRKSTLGLAAWILLVGGLLLVSTMLEWGAGFWDILWPSALLILGLFSLFPKFSFFALGCALFGGYFLLDNLGFLPIQLGKNLLLPIFLLLFGLSLLVDAIRKPEKSSFVIHHNGKSIRKPTTSCILGDNSFESNVAFGEDSHLITLPQLQNGTVNVSFGESTVDLSGCEEILPGCRIEANCSFGELTIRVPAKYRVELSSSTSFASVEVNGQSNAETEGTITVEANASFGEVCINYI